MKCDILKKHVCWTYSESLFKSSFLCMFAHCSLVQKFTCESTKNFSSLFLNASGYLETWITSIYTISIRLYQVIWLLPVACSIRGSQSSNLANRRYKVQKVQWKIFQSKLTLHLLTGRLELTEYNREKGRRLLGILYIMSRKINLY